MTHVLILGIDSLVGRSLGHYLGTRCSVRGLWLEESVSIKHCPSVAISRHSMLEQLAGTDIVVFCGGASRSSWDHQFGNFNAELNWLKDCTAATTQSNTRMVYISSDALFSGPWMFQDDAQSFTTSHFATTQNAKSLIKFETLVSNRDQSLIVRTNVLNWQDNSFLGDHLNALTSGRRIALDAKNYATPIAAEHFSALLTECLQRDVTGTINISGAERTSPFGLMTLLTRNMENITAEIRPNTISQNCAERSLRCSRLRQELNLHPPVLKQTLEVIAHASCVSPQALKAAAYTTLLQGKCSR